jgi:16S rRNA (guanine527-N7)-methyltransferase
MTALFDPAQRLSELLVVSGVPALPEETARKFSIYLDLLQRWNLRTNLTSIRDVEGILSRHFAESIVAGMQLPGEIVSLLDFGSGAGFPGLPIALVRPELEVTLAESQHKKAAFLREAVRGLEINVRVHAGRAEQIGTQFDCVTMRAVDRMAVALPAATGLVKPKGCLAVLTTTPEAEEVARSVPEIRFGAPSGLGPGTDRILLLGRKE